MKDFEQMTDETGEKVLVNPEHIVLIYPNKNSVLLSNGKILTIDPKENKKITEKG